MSYQYKDHKYAHLLIDLQIMVYSVNYFAVEIGSNRVMTLDSNRKRPYIHFTNPPLVSNSLSDILDI